MTLHLADIASYQGTLTLAQLHAAGFDGINVKISHGLTRKSVHPQVAAYVADARAAGMALSSFHWLDASAPGWMQADYAHAEMRALGLDFRAAHVVDCEADASQVQYSEYCARMRSLLGRDFLTYSGAWWWASRRWPAGTRWLWSAPGAGYLPQYPGDASPYWAGYGSWPELAVMQYRVAKVNGIGVSQSAVRSDRQWARMTGADMSAWTVVPCLLALRDEFNALVPGRDKGADGTIGDTAHTSASDHTPDEDSDILRDHDADGKNEVHALDIDSTGPWPGPFARIIADVIDREREKWLDADDVCRLEYVIFDRKIYSRSLDFAPRAYTGSDPHTNHAHFSARYITKAENDTRPWGVKGDTLSAAEVNEIKAAIAASEKRILDRIGTVAADILGAKYGSKAYEGRTVRQFLQDLHAVRDDFVGDGTGAGVSPVRAGSYGDITRGVPGQVDEVLAILKAGGDA